MGIFTNAGISAQSKLVLGLSVLAMGGLLGAGCGGGDDSSTSDSATSGDTAGATAPGTSGGSGDNADAVALFDTAGCAGCHVFSPADASGPVGPSLDDTTMSESEIVDQINNGGGAMPAYEGQISTEEVDALANLIATSN